METHLPHPVLATVAADALRQPLPIPAIPEGSFKRFSDALEGVVFYGILGFGLAFPFVATIYALIVY